MGNFPSLTISQFKGMNTTRDKLSCLPGQLAYNQNYLYMLNGGLEERGGGAKLTENPNYAITPTDPIFSLTNYKNNANSEFLLANQDASVYYYNAGWHSMGVALTPDQKMRWETAGYDADRSHYGVNGVDQLVKVYTSGGVPVAKLVTVANGFLHESPAGCMFAKNHKNRLFICDGKDTIYYSEVLDFDDIPVTNNFKVAPGVDGYIMGWAVWGDSLFIFKEYGIYVLPNAANSPVATATESGWSLLRCDAVTGTQSPDSIVSTKVGIIYFASDNVFRLVNPTVTFSSGEYTLGGTGTPIISHDIEGDLTETLSVNAKASMVAFTMNDLYVASFQTVDNGANYNDMTVFADLTKWTKYSGIVQAQPYWGFFTGFNFNQYALQTVSGRVKVYGAKGLDGSVHETLNSDIHNDNGGPIEARAVLAWFPIGGESLYKKVQHLYFVGDTENWNIDIVYQTYRLGEVLPNYGEGTMISYATTSVEGIGVVGTAIVGTAAIGQVGVGSDKQRVALKGYYFAATFQNLNADEFTRINKMIIYFRPIRKK